MRVDIKSNNPVTSEQVKKVIDKLNEDYAHLGIVVKNLTMYIRFQDETGKTVEPLEDGQEIKRIHTFKSVIKTEDSPK
jgi:hypothetical protein